MALLAISISVAIIVAIVVVEILAGVLFSKNQDLSFAERGNRGRVAVLIPAHNEGPALTPTLRDVKEQLAHGDRVIVIADNCTDDTAGIAAAAGAEVVIRQEPSRLGKGYALDRGIAYLKADPPDVVIVIDADCRLSGNCIDRLATLCTKTQRPIQSLYTMTAPSGASVDLRVAEFAWRVRNWIRPLGLSVLGLPCQLMGTGMAFPWRLIASADLATGHLVEDLKLGLDTAREGSAPLFCPSAVVTSTFPVSRGAIEKQRQRWERGHLGMILSLLPKFLIDAVAHRSPALLVLALDLAVPPLTVLLALVAGVTMIGALGAWAGLSLAPFVISVTSLLAVACALILAWLRYGRDVLPPRQLWLIGRYALAKVRIYRGLLSNRPLVWARTDRDGLIGEKPRASDPQ